MAPTWRKVGFIVWVSTAILAATAALTFGQLPPVPVLGEDLALSIEGTWYMVVARHSDKCIDVPDGNMRELAHVQQFRWHNGDNQFWRFDRRVVDGGTPYYSITNMRSSLSLEVADASGDDTAAIVQSAYCGRDSQLWKMVPSGDGFYYIVNRNSGKCIDVADASQDDMAAVQQYRQVGGQWNQLWSLQPDTHGVLPADGLRCEIRATHSGRCLDVPDGSPAAGVPIQQFAWHDALNQVWRLEWRSRVFFADYFSITNVQTSLCLGVDSGNYADSARVVQSPYVGVSSQLWRLQHVRDDVYHIVNLRSGKCLDVADGAQGNQASVVQYSCGAEGERSNQLWQLLALP